MLALGLIAAALAYLGLLFAVASWGDRRADQGRSVIHSPFVYTLSLAVYCTAWTFYGSVGLAAREGLAFLPVYLGPTLVCLLFPFVLEKMLRIARAQNITSIADFIAARYGKSHLMAGLVALVAVLSAVPYISLQLKAVATSVQLMLAEVAGVVAAAGGTDMALLVTLALALFSILFGTRHIDATERHEGIVLAVALESLVKLVAFLLVGGLALTLLLAAPDGALNSLAAAATPPLTLAGSGLGWADWLLLTILSGLAFLCLDRQFQVAVIENVDPRHVRTASWLMPLYLILINLLVLPIALAGRVAGIGQGDLLVLELPLAAGQGWLALAAFLGGLSAATAMIIVTTVALSTMISNDLVMPLLLRLDRRQARRTDLSRLVIAIRRIAIVLMLLLGYAFFRSVGGQYGLVSIGLISFAGVAQVAPALLAGLYWRDANLTGAALGLVGGVLVWAYCLVLPTLAEAGVVDAGFVAMGPWQLELLRPHALFGLAGLDPVAHALLWSMAVNLALLVLGGLLLEPGRVERLQAVLYVEAHDRLGALRSWRGEVEVVALRDLLGRFVGAHRADAAFALAAGRRGRALALTEPADGLLVQETERLLAGAIGAASARVMLGSVVRGAVVGPDELLAILDETRSVISNSRALEEKSCQLERATAELRRANARLRELDQLKDDFIASISHELRTPLTSIRAFSEILRDAPDLALPERHRFLDVVIAESERLTRLIDTVLDLSKIESGQIEWRLERFDLGATVDEALALTAALRDAKAVAVEVRLVTPAPLEGDRDRVLQVVINLLSNAAKFAPAGGGRIRVSLERARGGYLLRVEDNGPGVPATAREAVFEKFRQAAGTLQERPTGTGLGLTISRQIVERLGGRIWVEDAALGGAALCCTFPATAPARPDVDRRADVLLSSAGGSG